MSPVPCDPRSSLVRLVGPYRRRLTVRETMRGAALGGAAALALAALVLGVGRLWAVPLVPPASATLRDEPRQVALLLACALAAGAAIGAAAALTRRPGLRAVALCVDRRAGLEDRLSTALDVKVLAVTALGHAAAGEPLAGRLAAEAARLLRSSPPSRLFPLTGVRLLRWPVLGLAAAFLVSLVPPMSWGSPPPAREPVRLSPETVRELEEEAEELERWGRWLQDEEAARLAAEMRRAAEALGRGDLTRQEAAARLSELERRTVEERDRRDAARAAAEAFARAVEEGDPFVPEAGRAGEADRAGATRDEGEPRSPGEPPGDEAGGRV
ncbi:MAG: hypothetical protein HY722_07275, partial [Planctomycetes bacterium]|nr:hypothetical protein [Planctomycetota bacterium]